MKNKVLFVLCLLTGLMFINAGLNKFFHYMPLPEDMPAEMMAVFAAMMQISWLFPLIAIVEIIGGALFIIPRFRALGALMLTPIMVGILAHAFTFGDLLIPLILAAVLTWAIIEEKDRYMPLISK